MNTRLARMLCRGCGRVLRVCFITAMMLGAACSDDSAGDRDNLDGERTSAPPPRVRDGTWDEALTAGQSVTVDGAFLGNDPESLCEWAPTSRSRPRSGLDWAIRKERRCMWVGQGQTIFGDPQKILDRSLIGRAVAITATVRSDDTGRLYLEFVNGRPGD